MEIILNNQTKELGEGSNLYNVVLEQLGENQKGIAIAVNNIVIPRQNWPITKLKAHDEILIIKATQGG